MGVNASDDDWSSICLITIMQENQVCSFLGGWPLPLEDLHLHCQPQLHLGPYRLYINFSSYFREQENRL